LSKAKIPVIRAVRDPTLQAIVLKSTPLLYQEGANLDVDRPSYVRAGSSLSWFGDRLALVQDDANFLALVDPKSFEVEAISLPAGEAGLRQFDDLRGNKRFKIDLEACTTIPTPQGDLLLAFGSGSTARRDQILMVRETDPARFTLNQSAALYDQLRACTAFSGSELNLEGAIFQNGWIRLLNRGNGAPQGSLLPVNSTGDWNWDELAAYLGTPEGRELPHLRNICQYDLGNLNGLRLSFTDATMVQQSVIFSATAEDSPDATLDGAVSGSALGILDGSPRWIELRTPDNALFMRKVEGVCASRENKQRLFTVIDVDDPTLPCELCEVELTGKW